MAQFLAERLAREAGLPLRAVSAGVEAEIGKGMTPGAVRALAARGIRGARHIARQLDEGMLAFADDVYAMTREHKAVMAARFPAHESKIRILREAAGLPGDVEDPYGESDAVYEECAGRIEEALTILIQKRDHHVKNNR